MGSQAYNKENVKQVKLALNLKTDADIIRKLGSVANMQGYIKDLIRRDSTMMISLDNGVSYLTAAEAMPEIRDRNLWDAVVNMMNDGLREEVAQEGLEDEESFLARYLELSPDNLILG